MVRLDETVTRANLAIVTKGLNELYARKARLGAERDGADTVAMPQRACRQHRRSGRQGGAGQRAQAVRAAAHRAARAEESAAGSAITQLQEEITGLTAQQDAKTKEIGFIEQELAGVRDLWKKNLVQLNRLTALEREAARLAGRARRS